MEDKSLEGNPWRPQELGFAECDVEEYLEKYLGNMGFPFWNPENMGGNICVAGSFRRDLPVCDRPRLPMNGVTRPAWQARDGAISGYWSYFGTC